MRLTEETDNFGFRVLAFNVLTRIHPFGGNYKKSPNMNTVERIKNGLSLLGPHDIVYNEALFNWSWMSPKLLETMRGAFEGDRRDAITNELDEQCRRYDGYRSKSCIGIFGSDCPYDAWARHVFRYFWEHCIHSNRKVIPKTQ